MFQVKWVSGISDDTARAKTGKKWGEWYAILDKAGARMMDHAEIVLLGREKLGLSQWWSRLLAVGYEQERGVRIKRQRGARHEVYRSRRFAAPLAAVWAAWQDQATLASWLPGMTLQVRKCTLHKVLQFDLPDNSRVAVSFSENSGKTRVAVAQGRLPAGADLKRQKDYWSEALERLNGIVAG
jgi:hypothetical protein